jgi:Ca-activated chloride channel homolog
MKTKVLLLVCLSVLACACGGAQRAPEGEDPELVVLEGELGNSFVTAGEASDIVSRIRIATRPLENAPRPPINLALVVDTSGSMEGDAIADAREASLALLSTLRPEDRLAVVAFHSETEVLLESTKLEGADTAELRRRISRMEARGTTDLGGGLRAGLEELVRHYEPDGINRLVLLSDGVPNDPAPILPLAQAAGERGIRITALGLGLDYDEQLLQHVAEASGGRYHFVEESTAVAQVFRQEVLRFERVVARNLALELRPGPGVRIEGVVGQPTSVGSGVVRVALGDLSEGEERDVIVRMHAEPRRRGATVELMDAVLSFEDGVANAGALERRVFLGARATDDAHELTTGRNEEVEQAAARVIAALTTVQAIERAREGDVAEARAILDRAASEALEVAESSGDERLRAQVTQMRVLGQALPSIGTPAAVEPAEYRFEDEEVEGSVQAAPETILRRTHESAVRTMENSN